MTTCPMRKGTLSTGSVAPAPAQGERPGEHLWADTRDVSESLLSLIALPFSVAAGRLVVAATKVAKSVREEDRREDRGSAAQKPGPAQERCSEEGAMTTDLTESPY